MFPAAAEHGRSSCAATQPNSKRDDDTDTQFREDLKLMTRMDRRFGGYTTPFSPFDKPAHHQQQRRDSPRGNSTDHDDAVFRSQKNESADNDDDNTTPSSYMNEMEDRTEDDFAVTRMNSQTVQPATVRYTPSALSIVDGRNEDEVKCNTTTPTNAVLGCNEGEDAVSPCKTTIEACSSAPRASGKKAMPQHDTRVVIIPLPPPSTKTPPPGVTAHETMPTTEGMATLKQTSVVDATTPPCNEDAVDSVFMVGMVILLMLLYQKRMDCLHSNATMLALIATAWCASALDHPSTVVAVSTADIKNAVNTTAPPPSKQQTKNSLLDNHEHSKAGQLSHELVRRRNTVDARQNDNAKEAPNEKKSEESKHSLLESTGNENEVEDVSHPHPPTETETTVTEETQRPSCVPQATTEVPTTNLHQHPACEEQPNESVGDVASTPDQKKKFNVTASFANEFVKAAGEEEDTGRPQMSSTQNGKSVDEDCATVAQYHKKVVADDAATPRDHVHDDENDEVVSPLAATKQPPPSVTEETRRTTEGSRLSCASAPAGDWFGDADVGVLQNSRVAHAAASNLVTPNQKASNGTSSSPTKLASPKQADTIPKNINKTIRPAGNTSSASTTSSLEDNRVVATASVATHVASTTRGCNEETTTTPTNVQAETEDQQTNAGIRNSGRVTASPKALSHGEEPSFAALRPEFLELADILVQAGPDIWVNDRQRMWRIVVEKSSFDLHWLMHVRMNSRPDPDGIWLPYVLGDDCDVDTFSKYLAHLLQQYRRRRRSLAGPPCRPAKRREPDAINLNEQIPAAITDPRSKKRRTEHQRVPTAASIAVPQNERRTASRTPHGRCHIGEDTYDPTSCGICASPFSTDVAGDHAPILSSGCQHTLCLDCVKRLQPCRRGKNRDCMRCPYCDGAFDMRFMHPNALACELLKENAELKRNFAKLEARFPASIPTATRQVEVIVRKNYFR